MARKLGKYTESYQGKSFMFVDRKAGYSRIYYSDSSKKPKTNFYQGPLMKAGNFFLGFTKGRGRPSQRFTMSRRNK
tara:strand:- start:287 stop:514 length:228 start_codon:yes stop_codon:yes gene_type:complete